MMSNYPLIFNSKPPENPEKPMHIVIICGSQQTPSQSRKVGNWLAQRLTTTWTDEVSLFDLGERPVPLWNPGESKGAAPYSTTWGPIADALQTADAVICITPEWCGMATPAIKNFLLMCSADLVGHKPALAVGVSASRGGTWPIAELRGSGFKNNRLCWIPEHLIIRNVGDQLESTEGISKPDPYIRKRIDYTLALLRSYAQALKNVRDSGIIDHENYPNGM